MNLNLKNSTLEDQQPQADPWILAQQFAQKQGYDNVEFLAGDCSFRRYYRLTKGTQTYVLMYSPPSEKIEEFLLLSNLLVVNGFSAPRIHESYPENNLYVIEDFGDKTFTTIFKELSAAQKQPFYKLALETLNTLHQNLTEKPDFVPLYTVDLLIKELDNVMDWVWPYYKKSPPSPQIISEFQGLWREVFKNSVEMGQSCLVLRDYHIDNVIHLPNRPAHQACGLLDYQDACWGWQSYDYMSILEDARTEIPIPSLEELWDYVDELHTTQPKKEFYRQKDILGACRHAKIVGRFTRQKILFDRNDYLRFLPRTWYLFNQSISSSTDLSSLKEWFNVYFKDELQASHPYVLSL